MEEETILVRHVHSCDYKATGLFPTFWLVSQQLCRHPWINHFDDIYSNVLAGLQSALKRIQWSRTGQQCEPTASNVNVMLVCVCVCLGRGCVNIRVKVGRLWLFKFKLTWKSLVHNSSNFFIDCNWQLWHCISGFNKYFMTPEREPKHYKCMVKCLKCKEPLWGKSANIDIQFFSQRHLRQRVCTFLLY